MEYLLQHHNFRHYSVRDVLVMELTKLGKELTRDNMLWMAIKLREENGAGYFMETLLAEAEKSGGDSIIESIRTVGEVEAMREKSKNFILFAVDADPKIRYERIIKRNNSTDRISFEKFMEDEANESFSTEKWKNNLPACSALADYTFHNNGNVEDFFAQVEEVMKKL